MATKRKKLKGNKGEWSELYAFLKLLSERKLYAADEDLGKIGDLFYPVLKVMRSERKFIKTYDITKNGKIKLSDDGKIITVNASEINSKLKKIFERIKEESGGSFEVKEARELMDKLHCSTLKASSIKKSDLVLLLSDIRNRQMEEVGFSIKSTVGGAATLLNPVVGTNFIYRVKGLKDNSLKKINAIDTSSKIKDRLKEIHASGGKLEFVGVQSDKFEDNLVKIDSAFPEILGEIVKMHYEGTESRVSDLVERLAKNGSFGPKVKSRFDFYEYKVKNLLQAVALGMTPSKLWNGTFDAQGGYIIVKDDGELVCYHVYNQDKFREYLFRSTKLETPSSSRFQFGSVYTKGGEKFIKLNLQVRFI